ncbi:hypothetical protein N9023_04585 [Opitutaceae bacterium]|nr:hypothetical protein [Opitutaceae bacterium]MDB4474262.1 hypothetical protein [Opitutaceae bacterium]
MATYGQDGVPDPQEQVRELQTGLFNQDFTDFLKCLHDAEVESMLVGGYAVVLHGYPRTTGDMDVWVRPTPENHKKLIRAFAEFGLPTDVITLDDFLTPDEQDVFTFGRPPVALDILTHVKGLEFDDAFANAESLMFEGSVVRLIHVDDLKQAKRSAGRYKDLNDLENL